MTRDDDFIGQVEGYLDEYEGMTPLPDGVRNAVRAKLPTTKQIGPVSGLMRDLYMNRTMDTRARWALVAASIIAAVIIGGVLFSDGSNVVEPPSSSPTPALPESPSPTAASFTDHPGGGEALEPGSYVITHAEPFRITVTVPAGWYKGRYDWAIFADPGTEVDLVFGAVDNLYADPCAIDLGLRDPAVGRTVDDLATALGTVPGLEVTSVSDLTLAGFAGQYVELAAVQAWEGCFDEPRLWQMNGGDFVPAPEPAEGGRVYGLYILDVNGDRLAIGTFVDPEATAEQRAELQAMLDSIRIE